jgi:exopolysaccharide biosynthesis polyprenyl glycosylphosphotransferase
MNVRKFRIKQLLVFAATDQIFLLIGLALAYALRFHTGIIEVTKGYDIRDYLQLLPLAMVVWAFWLEATGCYDFRDRAFNMQILARVIRAAVFAMMSIIAIHFFMRALEISRLFYAYALFTTIVSVASGRLLLDRVLAHLRRKGKLRRANVLILGTGPLALYVAQRIRRHALLGLRMVGFVSDNPEEVGQTVGRFPVLGDFENIHEVVRREHIAEIIVCEPELQPDEILAFIFECEKDLVTIRVVPNLLEAALVNMSVEQIDGIPLFGLKESPLQGWNVVMKRAFDIAASVTLMILLSPLLALIALLVKRTSPGPVFYRQNRVGLDGRKFSIVKFRSMTVDAEQQSGPVWANESDPRTTSIGRMLRRTNLDELPQLWNVLRGDMSLVGPRPERPHFVQQFREEIPRYMGRHRVKSGMTGWAQVNGLRGNTSIDERIKYDLYYIENWSFWLDLKILAMTLRANENAY